MENETFTNPVSPQRESRIKKITETAVKIQKSGDLAIDAFRTKMLEFSADGGFNGLRRCFRAMDATGESLLSTEQFATGLQEFGINYTILDVDKLFAVLDRDCKGLLSVNEFIRGVRPEMSMRRKNLVGKAYKLLDIKEDNTVKMHDLQVYYDTTQHPEVIAGHATPEQILCEFVGQWDKAEDDIVTLSEFLEYYTDISANIDSDDYFELMVRNGWHISGGEGVCRNTSCLRVLVTFVDARQRVVEIRDDLRLKRDDLLAIRAKLTKQGVESIASIDFI